MFEDESPECALPGQSIVHLHLHRSGHAGLRSFEYPYQPAPLPEVDRYYIAHATVVALAKDGKMTGKYVARAVMQYKIDPERPTRLGRSRRDSLAYAARATPSCGRWKCIESLMSRSQNPR
jgi:hypothetical protein